jgi:signal transduction histidine kinase
VKKIAQLYGGDATVASKPDVGSTFTVVLSEA